MYKKAPCACKVVVFCAGLNLLLFCRSRRRLRRRGAPTVPRENMLLYQPLGISRCQHKDRSQIQCFERTAGNVAGPDICAL